MSSIASITSQNFDEQVKNKAGVTVVRFWATWCGPCTRMKPVYEELASDLGERVSFGEVDIDIAPELAGQFGIRGVPAVLIFKDGEPVDGVVGMAPKSAYASKIEAQI